MAKEYAEQDFQVQKPEDGRNEEETNMATRYTKEDLVKLIEGKQERTIRSWIKKVKEVYSYLPSEVLSSKEGRRVFYSPFVLEALRSIDSHLKQGGNLGNWQPVAKSEQTNSDETRTVDPSAIEVLGETNLDFSLELPQYEVGEEIIDLNLLQTFGTKALVQAQQELALQQKQLATTKTNLTNSLLDLAKQAAMNQAAEEAQNQLELKQAAKEAFEQELQRLQATENARLQARQAYKKVKQNLGKQSLV